MPSELLRHWALDPSVTFLNHGSFGACPREVLELQSEVRARFEAEPVRYVLREWEPRVGEARAALAPFVGAAPEDLAFVTNATTGVNTVLRSFPFAAGDELVTTDHGYNACVNALRFVAERSGAKVVVAKVPFPLSDPQQVVDAVLGALTPRTRLLLLDHVTSPTGLVFPIEPIVREAEARGVRVLVDGAHGPGMVPLALDALGASYYAGNCHKWLCAPKGVGFLHVRRDRQPEVRPLVISHGANSPRTDRSRFQLEFDWTGTFEPSPIVVLPEVLRLVGGLVPGGWPEVMRRNRALALAARRRLCEALGIDAPAPESMIGSLAAVPVSDGSADKVQALLLDRHGLEVPLIPWPAPPRRLLRIAAQLYVSMEDIEKLVGVLEETGLKRA